VVVQVLHLNILDVLNGNLARLERITSICISCIGCAWIVYVPQNWTFDQAGKTVRRRWTISAACWKS
jgi:hypothetical protein